MKLNFNLKINNICKFYKDKGEEWPQLELFVDKK